MEEKVQELLKTIDVLKLLSEKGKGEVKGFAWYMVVWGFYGFINILVSLLFGKLLWIPLTLPAFWLTTIPVGGWGMSTLCWGILSAIVFGLGIFTNINTGFLIGIGAFGATFNYWFLYRYAIQKKKLIPSPRTSIAPKIGVFWGIMMLGMVILVNLIYAKTGATGADVYFGMWGYAIGMAMFISGIIAPGFYIIGLVAGFGVPIVCFFSGEAGMALYGIVTLLMGIYGLILMKK